MLPDERETEYGKAKIKLAEKAPQTVADRQAVSRVRTTIADGMATLKALLDERQLEPRSLPMHHKWGGEMIASKRPLDVEDFRKWLPPESLASFVKFAIESLPQDYSAAVLDAAQAALNVSDRGARILVAREAGNLRGLQGATF